MKEKDIQKAVLEYFNMNGFWVWRNNSGAFVLGDKKKRFFRAGFSGISDLIGIAPDGKFIAVEVKRKGGKLTEKQKHFLELVRDMGGYALVVYSIDDAINFIDSWKRNLK